MNRNHGILFALFLLLFCLSGCMFRSVDELYAPPKTSETFLDLQKTIDATRGSAESIAPISGGRTQTIQLYDLLRDENEQEEAIAFFRDSAAEKPLKIAIFTPDAHNKYQLYVMIENAGSDIGSIEYVDLVGDEAKELVVTWQTAAVQNLVAYSISEGRVEELMRSSFSRYLSADLDSDGKSELYLSQIDAGSPDGNRLEMYVGDGSVMQLNSSAFLSNGVVPVMERGFVQESIPALFVTSEFGESSIYRVTDVFFRKESGIRNITMDETTQRSSATTRVYTGLGTADINKDGITEVPVSVAIQSPGNVSGSDFWKILWKQFDADGNALVTMQTYHNNNDGWYLIMPDSWDGKITLARSETNTSNLGERAVIFSYWEGNPLVPPEPFLTIYRLTGANRERYATVGDRFRLIPEYQDTDAVYAAILHECSWEHGLNEDIIKSRFHSIIN